MGQGWVRYGRRGKVRFVRYGMFSLGKAGAAWCGEVRRGSVGYGRLKPERRKSEVGRHKQKAILIRHKQVQSVR